MTDASNLAHQKIKPISISIRENILFEIRLKPFKGATKHDLEISLKLKHQTLTGQLSFLQDEGRIYNLNESRHSCTVYYATPEHRIEFFRKKQRFIKFQKYLNHGKKHFNLPDSTVDELIAAYVKKHGVH